MLAKLVAARRAALLLLPILLAGATPSLASDQRTKAPNFRAVDMAGERFTLEEMLGEGPILIDFWATWCKPCIKELPYVQRLCNEYMDKGLQVLAVTIDSPKSQNQVRKFIKTRKYDFRVVMDAEQDVFRKMQGKGTIPYVVILDSEGFIRYHHTGYRPGDEKELKRVVDELLAEAAGGDAASDGADGVATDGADPDGVATEGADRDGAATDGAEPTPQATSETAG